MRGPDWTAEPDGPGPVLWRALASDLDDRAASLSRAMRGEIDGAARAQARGLCADIIGHAATLRELLDNVDGPGAWTPKPAGVRKFDTCDRCGLDDPGDSLGNCDTCPRP